MTIETPTIGSRPAELFLGRYRAERVLKTTTSSRSVLAVAPDGSDVVVKLSSPTAASGDVRLFDHEAAALRRIASPWIAPLVDTGVHDGSVCIVTRYINGTSLDRRLHVPLAIADVVTLGTCLLRALRDAHEAGVVHRDVKPSNIVTNTGPSIERATLIDFGLSISEELVGTVRGIPVGTAIYMSPEQSGLLDREVDERSDLYAAGVVLYECLAGRPPFIGSTLGELLRQHVTARPPDLRELGVRAPRALGELVARLLAKDPRDRYQSADGVLADLDDIEAALARGETEPSLIVGARDRRHSLAEPAFVGRRVELAALEAELERARTGRGRVVLVEAESGGGKTRLLQEFAHRGGLAGARIFRGQGIDQGAQRPFEVLRGLGVGLLELAGDVAYVDHLGRELGDRADAACGALPELAVMLDASVGPSGPEEFGQLRALEALETLLTALGTADEPALLVLDDCQWADELTLKLLSNWHAHREDGARHVLIAVAFRSEEIGPGHVLRLIEDPIRLELEPLRADEIQLLAESMAGPIPDEANRVVVELAEGSPFMASAVLRGLVESGALAHGLDGWRVDADVLADAGASRRAGTFLAQRLALLEHSTRDLLEAGAILGKEFDHALASELAGGSAEEAARPLREARRRHMVWVRGGRCAFVHDKVREAVLAGLSDERRAELHTDAAKRIERIDPRRIFEIAYHLDAAGDSAAALHFALAAADAAREGNALAVAQENYEIADRGSVGRDTVTRSRILEGLGDVLMLRGRYADAAPRFEQAVQLADDPLARARLEGKVGELAFKRGDVKDGTTALERALRALGRRTPQTFAGMLVRMLWEVVVQVGHTYLPKRWFIRRSHARMDADLLACHMYDKLAYAYWFYRGPFHAVWAQMRGLNLAERYPPSPILAKAMSTHVAALSIIVPWFHGRTIRFAERAHAIFQTFGDLWGQAQALHFHGVALHSVAKYAECIEKMREAVRLLERSGDRWEANTASWHMAYAHYRLGDRDTAIEIARSVHRTGVEIGDAQARGISLSAWAKAADGHIPPELVAAEMSRPGDDTHTTAEVLAAEGIHLLAERRFADAEAVFESAIDGLRSAHIMHVYVAPLFTWRATALRGRAERSSLYERRATRRSRRAWRRAARRALIVGRVYPTERPHAYREVALHGAATGRARRAERYLKASLAAAEAQGARRERAHTMHALGTVGSDLGWPGAGEHLTQAAAALAALDAAARPLETVTASLVDRFDSILEQGRYIASALSKDTIWAAVRNAAMTLLRAERCVVLELKQGEGGASDTLVPVAGSAGGDFSTTVAWRAVAEEAPVTMSEDDAIREVSESLVLAGVRSSLAAPILARGRTVACFYIDHKGVGGLFGPDEERIADFIATVAGAALENSEGFAEVRALTSTLERRVAERTTELANTNARLEQTLGDLKRLDQLKTEFMAMAAHDLRTPMTVIAGFSGELRDRWNDFDDATKRNFLDRINANTKRLSEFVENLLHFARIESGEFSYDPQPFDLGALAVRTASEQSGADGTDRIFVNVDEAVPLALGDEQRTWQVLTNLLSNALKFSEKDTLVIVEVLRSNNEVEVSVTDRGPGISVEDQALLFQKFARVGPSNGPLGTGLGLFICRSIVEAQGGRMWVDSEPGVGSSFRFSLPTVSKER